MNKMKPNSGKLLYNLFIIVLMNICFFFIPQAEAVQYAYDDMRRLIKVEYEDGTIVDYVYDNIGNRLQKTTTLAGAPANTPPVVVSNPSIPDGASGVETLPLLSWTASSDPDAGDEVVYYVYFGESGNLSLISSSSETSNEPGQLRSLTSYCWQVVSRDSHNTDTEGPVWCFTTGNDPPVASFIADQTDGWMPFGVWFQDTSTSLDDEIVSWSWDFDNDASIDSTEQNPFHIYEAVGTYTVSLTVTDEHGLTSTRTLTDNINVDGDTDGDLVRDGDDNCPHAYNFGQDDMDDDGLGDPCDPDTDDDGIPNDTDNCVKVANPGQADTDGDGYGDACTMNHCVSNSAELQASMTEAENNGVDDVIQLIQGVYGISGNNNASFSYNSSELHSLVIRGGYTAGCSSRDPDPANTVLDGEGIGRVFSMNVRSVSSFAGIVIEDVTIQNGNAGGINVFMDMGNLWLRKNVIKDNSGDSAVSIVTERATVTLAGNMVRNNNAGYYAGLAVESTYGDTILQNNIIVDNTADNYGGGVFVRTDVGYISLTNNTLYQNSALASWGFGGGLYIVLSNAAAKADIYNNIIWGNSASSGGDGLVDNSAGGTINVYNNGFDPEDVEVDFASRNINEGANINSAPQFADPAAGDYHLSSGSPFIDSGDNTAPFLPSEDFDGDDRLLGLTADVGADEYYVGGITYAIIGQIQSEGEGLKGIAVEFSGDATATKVTDGHGDYVLTWVADGNYAIIPSSPFYTFSPLSRNIMVSGSDVGGQDFVATAMDTDTDGVPDITDNCPTVHNPGQLDSDDDGMGDACASLPGSISGRVIDESTGLGVNGAMVSAEGPSWRVALTDAAGNYIITGLEKGAYWVYAEGTGHAGEFYNDADNWFFATPVPVNPGGSMPGINFALTPDADGDGAIGSEDNCPEDYNPYQMDEDNDGIGNECDSDADGDDVPNDIDNCVIDANPDQADGDGDGYGDACTQYYCVSTSAELQNALYISLWNGMNDVVQLVQGIYEVSGNNNSVFYYGSDEPYSLIIRGGYTAGCVTRELDPRNTILDGQGIEVVLELADWSSSAFADLIVEGISVQNGNGIGLDVYSEEMGNVLLTNNIIKGTIGDSGVSAYSYRGTVTLNGNIIADNTASIAAGVLAESDYGDTILTNNIITGNTADDGGGGVVAYSLGGRISLINNTITDNAAEATWGSAGGVYLFLGAASCVADIYNNIIWDNTAPDGGDIFIDNMAGGLVNVYRNDFDPAKVSGAFTSEGGNINADPLFVDADNGDYHLQQSSPCIDAGDNTAVPAGVTTDIDGCTRFFDDPNTDDTGKGTPPIVDMGADEYRPLVNACEGDLDDDGDVDGSDLANFVADPFDESDLAAFASEFARMDCLD